MADDHLNRDVCAECGETVHVRRSTGTLRSHPYGAATPCPGSGWPGGVVGPPPVKHEPATCPACGNTVRVKADGTLHRHPPRSANPCRGSDRDPNEPMDPLPVATPVEPPTPAVVRPGKYASAEPMLDPATTPVPPRHAVITLTAFVPYDGTNGRTPEEEAALLFEDPGYLYRVLDDTKNDRLRLVLHVPGKRNPGGPR